MDYGQPVKTPQDSSGMSDFLVAGPNGMSEHVEEVDKSINDLSAPLERNYRGIGGNAISNASIEQQGISNEIQNATNLESNNLVQAPGESVELGNVVNLEMPPQSKNAGSDANMADVAENAISFDLKLLNTKNGLKKDGVREVRRAINRFNRDGNASELYDSVRGENGMVINNLGNSYGDNAAWKKAA